MALNYLFLFMSLSVKNIFQNNRTMQQYWHSTRKIMRYGNLQKLRHCCKLWQRLSLLFISHCFKTLKKYNDWHLYGDLWWKRKYLRYVFPRATCSDEFICKMNLTCNKSTSFLALQNLSSADETVHIFNCTKIPLKFALYKLSGILDPSLIMTLQQFHRRAGNEKNFHFKRFLSYFHFEEETQVAAADASINLNNQ